MPFFGIRGGLAELCEDATIPLIKARERPRDLCLPAGRLSGAIELSLANSIIPASPMVRRAGQCPDPREPG
jgi:hypothetical protein